MGIQLQTSWRVLLVGDHCLDIYHYGICDRLSPEAPVPVLKQLRTETKMGMSSNVKMNLASFGIGVTHIHNVIPIEKHRIIDSRFNQHLMRYDVGEERPQDKLEIELVKEYELTDALVISDYNKGFITNDIIEYMCDLYRGRPIFVDSKKKDLSAFSNSLIKINEKEFNSLEKMPKNSKFVVTLGDRGAMYMNKIYPTIKTEVFDVCGAGDVFLSSLVYGSLKHKNIIKAIQFANKCASFSVSKMGTHVLSKEEIKHMEETDEN